MGGRSSEHPISIASARSVIDSLDPERYEVVTVEIDHDGRWTLPSGDAPKALGSGLEAPPAKPATPGRKPGATLPPGSWRSTASASRRAATSGQTGS
jgi:D-alanine-D-alanine ligase-like ATP-grasp enzyme